MIYILLGHDSPAKDVKVEELKKKILPQPQSLHFDFEALSAHKLDPETFKKSLISLPAIASRRLVIVREAQKLSPHNQEVLEEFLRSPAKHLDLILDFQETQGKELFIKKIKGPSAQIFDFTSGPELNVFDMTKAIEMNKKSEALKILDGLFEQGIHPLQIMGGLVWFWGKGGSGFRRVLFEIGLLALQEADFNIKRSRLAPEHALEMLVVKLCF